MCSLQKWNLVDWLLLELPTTQVSIVTVKPHLSLCHLVTMATSAWPN